MKKLKIICVITVLLDFGCGLIFAIKPNFVAQLLGALITLILIFLLLISFAAGICFVRRDKFCAFIPAIICLVGLPASMFISSYLGISIRDWRFQKNLARYTDLIEKGQIKAGHWEPTIQLPDEFADLSEFTLARTNNVNGLVIEFIIGGGFPVKHSGYLCVSTGKIENDPYDLERWPFHTRINSNWFRISD